MSLCPSAGILPLQLEQEHKLSLGNVICPIPITEYRISKGPFKWGAGGARAIDK